MLFALLHGINVLLGQSGKATLGQILATFVAGTALFVILVSTGTLVIGVLLHAFWDFGTLGIQATGRKQ